MVWLNSDKIPSSPQTADAFNSILDNRTYISFEFFKWLSWCITSQICKLFGRLSFVFVLQINGYRVRIQTHVHCVRLSADCQLLINLNFFLLCGRFCFLALFKNPSTVWMTIFRLASTIFQTPTLPFFFVRSRCVAQFSHKLIMLKIMRLIKHMTVLYFRQHSNLINIWNSCYKFIIQSHFPFVHAFIETTMFFKNVPFNRLTENEWMKQNQN